MFLEIDSMTIVYTDKGVPMNVLHAPFQACSSMDAVVVEVLQEW